MKRKNWCTMNKEDRGSILLTISILVSGREETTRECLDSLRSLRNRVPSELILVDTGCSPEMRIWLETQANRVISYEWNHNFADARNAGLRQARGGWFLYLDDDEWFEATTEIEKFFLSGEYQHYEGALYKVRNYEDMQGRGYRDSYLSRIVKLGSKTQFRHPLYETIYPFNMPAKLLEDFVHHYGYVSEDDANGLSKRQRNLSRLLAAIKVEPDCMRYYAELMNEYAATSEMDKSLETARTGILHYAPNRDDNNNYLDAMYANVVRCLVNLGRYKEACKETQRMLQERKISALAAATICKEITYACFRLEDYQLGLKYTEQYLCLKQVFEENRDAYLEQKTMILDTCFKEEQYRSVMGLALAMAYAGGCLEKAEQLMQKEDWQWWMKTVRTWCQNGTVEDVQKVCCSMEKISTAGLDVQYISIVYESFYLAKKTQNIVDIEKLRDMICLYCKKVVLLYEQMYRDIVLKEYPSLLPSDCKSAFGLQKALVLEEQNQEMDALQQLKEIAGCDIILGEVVRRYAAAIRQKISKRRQDQDRKRRELETLGEQVKQKALFLVEQGQQDAALVILEQLNTLLPEDDEVEEIKRRIYYKRIHDCHPDIG